MGERGSGRKEGREGREGRDEKEEKLITTLWRREGGEEGVDDLDNKASRGLEMGLMGRSKGKGFTEPSGRLNLNSNSNPNSNPNSYPNSNPNSNPNPSRNSSISEWERMKYESPFESQKSDEVDRAIKSLGPSEMLVLGLELNLEQGLELGLELGIELGLGLGFELGL
jgi:hypothetical protein